MVASSAGLVPRYRVPGLVNQASLDFLTPQKPTPSSIG